MLPLWGAWLAGLTYGLPLGPVFVVALHQVRRRGHWSGIAIWTGSLLSDLMLIGLGMGCSGMVNRLLASALVRQAIGLTTGLVLLVLGVVLLRSKPDPVHLEGGEGEPLPGGGFRGADVFAGFSFNTLNIGNAFFWLGVTAAYPGWPGPLLSLVGLLPTFALKHWICAEMARRLRPLWMLRMMRLAGILMLALSGFSFFQTLG